MFKIKKDLNFDEFISNISSKKGTTKEGLNFLNEKNFEEIVKETVKKAIRRSEELG